MYKPKFHNAAFNKTSQVTDHTSLDILHRSFHKGKQYQWDMRNIQALYSYNQTQKFKNNVQFQTAQIPFKVKKKIPESIKKILNY